jgi:hypothetical protein
LLAQQSSPFVILKEHSDLEPITYTIAQVADDLYVNREALRSMGSVVKISVGVGAS